MFEGMQVKQWSLEKVQMCDVNEQGLWKIHPKSSDIPWFLCKQSSLAKEVSLEKHIYSFTAFISLLGHNGFAFFDDVELIS